jgi:hypothetical protein
MTLVVPNEGEIRLLDNLLRATAKADNYSLRLYSNDYTPNTYTHYTDLDEATFTSYATVTLARGSGSPQWGVPAVNGNKVEATYSSQIAWTCGATGQTIYGYWIEDQSDRTVLWAEQFAMPRSLGENDILTLTPKFAIARNSDDL